jgi:hypothetical protein
MNRYNVYVAITARSFGKIADFYRGTCRVTNRDVESLKEQMLASYFGLFTSRSSQSLLLHEEGKEEKYFSYCSKTAAESRGRKSSPGTVTNLHFPLSS